MVMRNECMWVWVEVGVVSTMAMQSGGLRAGRGSGEGGWKPVGWSGLEACGLGGGCGWRWGMDAMGACNPRTHQHMHTVRLWAGREGRGGEVGLVSTVDMQNGGRWAGRGSGGGRNMEAMEARSPCTHQQTLWKHKI